jgi:hypothetical protein
MGPFITRLVEEWCGRQESDTWEDWDIYGFCRVVKTAVEKNLSPGQAAAEFRKALTELRAKRGWSEGQLSDIIDRIDSAVRLIYLYVSAFPYAEETDDDPFPYPH